MNSAAKSTHGEYPLIESLIDFERRDETARTYVDCADCADAVLVAGDVDPVAWALAHAREKAMHTRFRMTTHARFSVAPPGYPYEPFPSL
jgi:hypothetical protein